jgi:hypothetical protein
MHYYINMLQLDYLKPCTMFVAAAFPFAFCWVLFRQSLEQLLWRAAVGKEVGMIQVTAEAVIRDSFY